MWFNILHDNVKPTNVKVIDFEGSELCHENVKKDIEI